MSPTHPADFSVRLALLLRTKKEDLIQRWTGRVLADPQVPEANRLSGPELRDFVPRLIDRIVEELSSSSSGEASGRALGSDEKAKEHAHHRIREQYTLGEAMRELSHLRASLLDLCDADGVLLVGRAAQLIHAVIDEGMTVAAIEMERASNAALRADAEIRERSMGILGHDLRNPVTAIAFTADALLKTREGMTEAHTKGLQRISTNAERIGRLINDLLDLTRIRSGGGLPVEPVSTDLHLVCRRVLDELEAARPNSKLVFATEGSGKGHWDPDRLAQIVSNLVGNALDYSVPGTPVRIAIREQGNGVVLEVNNQGPTIAPEQLAKLFDPFRRGAQEGRAGKEQGLGLGLFIVKQIVDAHGGGIEVTSTQVSGTTFSVWLPRQGGSSSGLEGG